MKNYDNTIEGKIQIKKIKKNDINNSKSKDFEKQIMGQTSNNYGELPKKTSISFTENDNVKKILILVETEINIFL